VETWVNGSKKIPSHSLKYLINILRTYPCLKQALKCQFFPLKEVKSENRWSLLALTHRQNQQQASFHVKNSCFQKQWH